MADTLNPDLLSEKRIQFQNLRPWAARCAELEASGGGMWSDYAAWEEWFGGIDDTEILDTLEFDQKAILYNAMFNLVERQLPAPQQTEGV